VTISKDVIEAASEGLHCMVYRDSSTGRWHPSYQDWVDLTEYVEAVQKLIEAAEEENK
jgi:hypothetical protein